jgi:hypothetical protein
LGVSEFQSSTRIAVGVCDPHAVFQLHHVPFHDVSTKKGHLVRGFAEGK